MNVEVACKLLLKEELFASMFLLSSTYFKILTFSVPFIGGFRKVISVCKNQSFNKSLLVVEMLATALRFYSS